MGTGKTLGAWLAAAIAMIAGAAVLGGCMPGEEDREKRPLFNWFSRGRGDNYAGSTLEAQDESVFKAYVFVRNEGLVSSRPGPGLVALELYWNEERADYFLTGTDEGRQAARDSGYELVRVEGWGYETSARGRLPLKLFWSEARADNYTTANPQGEKDALAAGYVFVRNEAYIDPP